MKSKILSILVFALVACFWACSDDDDELAVSSVNVNGGPVTESVTPTSAQVKIVLNRTAGVKQVGITYGVQSDKSALLTYGEVLTVETVDTAMYLEITGLESATGYYYVAFAKMEDASESYSVVRNFTTESADLFLSPSRLNRVATGMIDTVAVTTTFDSWEVAEYDYDWITYTKKDSLLILNTEDNLNNEKRIATLKVKAGSRTQSLTITQDIPQLSLSSDTLEISAKGVTDKYFVVDCDVKWSVANDPEAIWCTPRRVNDTVYFSADVNPGADERNARLTVSVSDKIFKKFVVAQRSGALAVTKSALSYGQKGGADGFVVESNNDNWTISSDKDWCKPVRLQGTDSVAVTVDPNNTDVNIRIATITVSSQDQTQTKTVKVSQEAGIVIVDAGDLVMNFWGGTIITKQVKAYSDGWSVKVEPASDFSIVMLDDNKFEVRPLTTNESAVSKFGNVTVSLGNLTKTFQVEQKPAEIGISPETLKFSYTAGSKSVTSVGGKYNGEIYMEEVSVPDDAKSWLTVALDGKTIKVTVTENSTGSTRTAVVTARWKEVTEEFTVTQLDASSVVELPALPDGELAGNYTLTQGGYTDYVVFGKVVYSKAEYDAIATEQENAGTANYDDRYAKFRAADYNYALGLDDGSKAYPLLFKVNNVESTATGAPAGAYDVEIVMMYEPVNTSLQSGYIAYYDKTTRTLYFEFDYSSWKSGNIEHCTRTLVFSE